MVEPDSLEQAARLYTALTNEPMRISTSYDEIVKALQSGVKSVPVEIPWKERRGSDYHERHQVIVTHIADGRVYFINALKTAKPPGTTVGGVDQGPLRRLEPSGEESIETPMFLTLFMSGGKAMLHR